MQKRQYFSLYVTLIFVMILPIFTIDIYLPSFPDILLFFAAQKGQVQSTLSLYLLGYGLAQLIYAPFTERFGRKKVLLVGLSIYLFATILCILMPTIHYLILARLAQGLGACAGSVIGRIIIMDIFKDKSAKAFSTIYPIIGTSPAIAPLIGGFLTNIFNSWKSNFIMLAIFCLITIAFIYKYIYETKTSTSNKLKIHTTFNHYQKVTKSFTFWSYASLFIGQYQLWFIYIMETPFIFHHYGLNAQEIGYLSIPLAVVFFGASKAVKHLLDHLSLNRLISYGFASIGIGCILYIIPIHLDHWLGVIRVITPMLFIMAGCATLAPLGTVNAMQAIPEESRSYASAILGFTQLSLGAILTFALAKLINGSLHTLSLSLITISLIMLAIYLIGIRHQTQRKTLLNN